MRVALLAGLFLAFASPASAAVVSYDFTGTIDSAGPFAAGTAFSGTIRYDNAIGGINSISYGDGSKNVLYAPQPLPLDLTIGGTSLTSAESTIELWHNKPGEGDIFFFTATDITGAYSFLFERFDIFGIAYVDGRPQGIPESPHASNLLTITRLSDSAISTGAASLTGLVNGGAIPEPATWAMLILGFGLVGGAMRRRTSRESLASYAGNRGVVS